MKSIARYFPIFFLLGFNSAQAQVAFQKTYGGAQDDYFNFVQQTSDGGYIMVGATNSFGAGSYDVYLVKTDLNGDTLWTRTYGGMGNEAGYEVQQTNDGGYIIIGATQSFGPYKVYLIKTDINGDTLWTKTYKPGAGGGGSSVKQTFDGGYILSCLGGNSGTGFLIKTDAVGDTLWTKSYKMLSNVYSKIQQTTDSGFIVMGTGDDGNGFNYVYLVKTSIYGNPVWKKSYKGNSWSHLYFGSSFQQTLDGGYIAVGTIEGLSSMGGGVYLVKTNALGDTLWTKSYGGDSLESGYDIQLTNDSGYIISGVTTSFGAGGNDVYLIKIDSLGDILWTKTYGSTDNEGGYSVREAMDGGYIIAGYTNSFGAGNMDAYLIKTDTNGNSGCYENGITTILRTPLTIVSLPVDTFFLDAILVNSYSSVEGSGGTINTICSTVDINSELTDNDVLNIFPNPAQDKFTINLKPEFINVNLEISNLLGEKIYFEELKSQQEMIICTKFLAGIYFITIRTKSQIISTKLIIYK